GHCQSELNKWRDKLVNYRRIKNYAHRVFDYALRMDIIDSNPFDKVTVPKRIETIEESEFENFYSKEELNEFLEYVKEDLDLDRSEEHTSELQSRFELVCRLLLEKKKK